MKEYTYSEARQRLSSLLNSARKDGAARIRRRDGQRFIVKPETLNKSPLAVSALNLKIDREEIVEIIRSSRPDYKKP
jgi:PHD/YefM family antitoxin component YafN of YafNO toxin-antitoxin module